MVAVDENGVDPALVVAVPFRTILSAYTPAPENTPGRWDTCLTADGLITVGSLPL